MNHSQDAGRQLASEVAKSRYVWSRRLSYSFLAHLFLYPPHVPSVETARPSLKRSTYPLSFPHMRVISPHTTMLKFTRIRSARDAHTKRSLTEVGYILVLGSWVYPSSKHTRLTPQGYLRIYNNYHTLTQTLASLLQFSLLRTELPEKPSSPLNSRLSKYSLVLK